MVNFEDAIVQYHSATIGFILKTALVLIGCN